MIKNIILDFGGVLVDWNPKYLYKTYFGDDTKMEFFLSEICPYEWNAQADAGRSTEEITNERIEQFPQWSKEIKMYFDRWVEMMGEAVPNMYELVKELKSQGYKLYGLSNWSAQTFPLVCDNYPVFSLLDGIVLSGRECMVKPDIAIYKLLLERYGLKGEECVFIDDNPVNAMAGESLGIRGIQFLGAEDLKDKLMTLLEAE